MAFDLDHLGQTARVRTERGTRARWVRWALDGPLGAVVRLMWRPRIDGWSRLPDGPFIVVANHSGGGVAEGAAILMLWRAHFGDTRPLAPMAHAAAMHLPGVSRILTDVGAVPSTRAAVRQTLSEGVPVLTFPGGDHETWRPIWQAHRVDLAGRTGVLRLAHAAGVPLVPLTIRGSHFTNPVLWRSRLLPYLAIWPRLARVRALPISLSAVLLGLLTAALIAPHHGWLVGAALGALWPIVPLTWSIPWVPSSIRMRIGAPIAPPVFDDPETLKRDYDALVGAMQGLMDDLGR